MKIMKFVSLVGVVAITAALSSACGAVSNGGDDGSPTPEGSPTPNPGDLTIGDIQKGNVDVNTSVTLQGVVVTAVLIGDQGVDFWAQDKDGGAQSGIYFFDQTGVTPADIAIGDEVTVTGTYKEFYDLSEITIASVEITDTGLETTTDIVAVGDLVDPANAEVWEGCLIELDTTSDLTVAGAVNMYNEFLVTDGTDEVLVDDEIFDGTEGLGAGTPILFISGVFHYAFEEYKLLLRNEYDIETDEVIVEPLSIADIQSGTVAPDGAVLLENVIVTAVRGTTGFWAQDVGGGPNSGIYVFAQTMGTFPTGILVGDQVNVSGTYKEYFELSEIIITDVEITGSGNAVVMDTVTLADLDTPASVEQWESCLVNVTSASPMTVTAAANQYKEYPVGNGTNSLLVDDFIFDTSTTYTNGETVTVLSGVLNYSFSEWKLLPRSAADMQ